MKGEMVVGVAIEDSRPDPENPGECLVTIRVWGPAKLQPAGIKSFWIWLSFLCGVVIGAWIIGFLYL